MTTFDYTLQDLQNPSGKNGQSSFALYFQRLMYKESVYPSNVKVPLDTWYEKQYYGRVDKVQNTIIPAFSNLVPLRTTAIQNQFALNFVAEAFEELAAHMRTATILGVLRTDNANDKIYNMKAYQAYNDPTRIYSEYTQQLYNSYLAGLTLDENNKITNFRTFVSSWFNYLNEVAAFIPVTKTSYLLTDACNSFISGMSISIDLGPAQDDAYKYDNWISDPNFQFYIKAAKKFGLIVNKNTPWVLTADLFSDAIKKYFSRFYIQSLNSFVTEDNFFDVYYDKTCLTDVTDLKQITVSAYKTFSENNPLYQERVISPKCGTFKVFNRERQQLPANVEIALSDKLLVDLYLSLRSKETKEPVKNIIKLKKELASIYTLRPDENLTGVQNVAQYINTIYRDYIYQPAYLALDSNVLKNLDNRVRTGNIATVGSIAQQIY
jgi:hypothetical protein